MDPGPDQLAVNAPKFGCLIHDICRRILAEPELFPKGFAKSVARKGQL